uniref:Uncharacterized protein n=1 Tax=Micrurus surinamensis TaxID=129470 RepID=A0A2D4NSM5_MICSU
MVEIWQQPTDKLPPPSCGQTRQRLREVDKPERWDRSILVNQLTNHVSHSGGFVLLYTSGVKSASWFYSEHIALKPHRRSQNWSREAGIWAWLACTASQGPKLQKISSCVPLNIFLCPTGRIEPGLLHLQNTFLQSDQLYRKIKSSYLPLRSITTRAHILFYISWLLKKKKRILAA